MIMGEEHCGPGGCKLRIVDVSKVFEGRRGKVVALEGINLNIKGGEFVCLVGASGCGKTSLLNIIAGLEFPSSGVVELDGEPVKGPGRDRTVMFQESALFPWLDVMGNVMFGLKLTPGLTRGDRLAIAEKNLELVGLKECAHSHIHELSGGMKQRVALARALATSPRILLMDEPLSNLDAKLRNQMRAEIIKLRERIDTTFIYVTHDQTEAMTLGDRIVIMKDGFIQQIGTPQEVFDHPANLFVAGFIGMPQMNFFDAKLTRQNGRYAVTVGGVTVELSDEKQQRLAEHNVAEQDVTLGVRPDHLMLCADGIKGTVDVSEMMGSSVHLHVAAEGKDVIVIVPTNGAAAHFPMGSEVNMIFGGNVAHVFDKETGKNLEW